MDALLVQRAMFRASAPELHDVAGLVQEYDRADRLSQAAPDNDPHWATSRDQIEECLRLYVDGSPIRIAKRLSGYPGSTATER